MLYDDFINELYNWQGIFDGYIQSPGAYKEYFRLISEDVKDINTLRFCLENHSKKEKQFFPKPFEIKAYSEEFKAIIKKELYDSPFYKEIMEMKELVAMQKDCIVNKTDPQENLDRLEKIMIENEKQLKDLEEKRKILLKTKRIN